MFTLQQILWSAAVGLLLATIYTFYIKRVLGTLVRALLERDAVDAGSAAPLEDLNLKCPKLLRFALREGTDFSETVLCSDGKYYIPEDKIEKAERKYCGEFMSLFVLLLLVMVLLFTAIVCSYVFPELFRALGITV